MAKNGEIVRSPAETLEDFRTDVTPSLFIDNWGRDVVAKFGGKIKAQIDTAVSLAQLMSSIRTGEPLDAESLDTAALEGIAFVDGTDDDNDHFFSISLEPMFKGGSYDGPRVSAELMTGYVRLTPRNGADTTDAHYDERWSTKRGDVMPDRDSKLFDEDLRRLKNVLSVLETSPELTTERPESWPNYPTDTAPSLSSLTGLGIVETPVYVGESPLEGVSTEPDRVVRIPFLDD